MSSGNPKDDGELKHLVDEEESRSEDVRGSAIVSTPSRASPAAPRTSGAAAASVPSSSQQGSSASSRVSTLDDRINAKARGTGPRASRPGAVPAADGSAALQSLERDVLSKARSSAYAEPARTPGAVPSHGGSHTPSKASGRSSSSYSGADAAVVAPGAVSARGGTQRGSKASGRTAAESNAASDAARASLAHLEDDVLAKARSRSVKAGAAGGASATGATVVDPAARKIQADAASSRPSRSVVSASTTALPISEPPRVQPSSEPPSALRGLEGDVIAKSRSDSGGAAGSSAEAGMVAASGTTAAAAAPSSTPTLDQHFGGIRPTHSTSPPSVADSSIGAPGDSSTVGATDRGSMGPRADVETAGAQSSENWNDDDARGESDGQTYTPVPAGEEYPALDMATADVPLDASGGIQAFVAEPTVVEAENVAIIPSEKEELEMERRKYIRRGIIFACVLTAVLIAIIVPVTLRFTRDDSEFSTPAPTETPSSAPTEVPTSAPTSLFFTEVIQAMESVSGSERLQDPNSPAFRAAQWIAEGDPSGPRPLSDPRFIQRYTMAVFYFATDGDNWDQCSRNGPCNEDERWLSSSDECEWFGKLQCDDNRFVTKIDIATSAGNGLGGTLPFELEQLTALRIFIVQNNPDLGGTIPSELGNISSLTFVGLSGNSLTGTIPIAWLTGANQMNTIYLRNNFMHGSIPIEMTQLSNLTDLELDGNNFTGTIHSQFGLLPNLGIMELQDNRLNGAVPGELFTSSSSLTKFLAQFNELTGGIPSTIGQSTRLQQFNVGNNSMTGGIPSELYNVTTLEILDLSSNDFTGPLSDAVGSLVNLKNLILHGNMFSGNIPATLGTSVPNLHNLTLHDNDFSGTLAPEICAATGTLTTEIAFLTVDCDKVPCCTSCPVENCCACL